MRLRQATTALTAGILVTSTAGAASWSPGEWFARQASAPPAAATAVLPAASPVAPATAPN